MTTIDIDQIRSNCFDRAIKLCEAYNCIDKALVEVAMGNVWAKEADELANTNRMMPMQEACGTVLLAHSDRLAAEIHARLQQAAFLFARDVIAPMARESGNEAVVFITGNSYMPPLRSFDEINELYQVECELYQVERAIEPFVSFYEALESELTELSIYMACPEYGNSLYAVDLRRFEYVGDDQGNDNISDDWKAIA